MSWRNCCRLLLPVTIILAADLLPAQDPDLTVTVGSTSVMLGDSFTVPLTLDNSFYSFIYGWTVGVCHDSQLLAVADVAAGADLLLANGSWPGPLDFIVIELEPGGWATGVVIDSTGPGILGVGSFETHLVTYDVVTDSDTVTELCFCDTIGTPPIANQIVVDGVVAQVPQQVCGEVSIYHSDGNLRRGDCNSDGTVDLGDAIFALAYLLPGPGSTPQFPACRNACDINDDSQLNIADPIWLLIYLFQGGTQPPSPFPDCGVDPTAGTILDCIDPPLGTCN